jgi:hypothetical protein
MTFPPQHTRKIAVFRALQLGDMLCAVPALRALRHSYPRAEITLLGLPWAASFCDRFSEYVDRFIHFPGYPGLPEQPFDPLLWKNFVERMHNEQFDLILQMQGNGSIVNEMLIDLQAGPVAGFHSAGSYRDPDLFIEYRPVFRRLKDICRCWITWAFRLRAPSWNFPLPTRKSLIYMIPIRFCRTATSYACIPDRVAHGASGRPPISPVWPTSVPAWATR